MLQKLISFFVSFVVSISTIAQTLTIAAASNTRYALEEITKVYKEETGINVNLVFASSGKLTSQIMTGAPYDIFMSANKAFTDSLVKNGFTHQLPVPLIQGSLIVISNKKYDLNTGDYSLQQAGIKSIAIANPNTAPYGKASIEMLRNIGIDEDLKDKYIFVESISQVNQHIHIQSTDAGLTSKSLIYANRLNKDINWIEVDTCLYHPILHYLVLLKSLSKEQENMARDFMNFLQTETGQDIFTKFGYYRLSNQNE